MIKPQISLRTLFIIISVCGLVIAIVAVRVRQAQLEESVFDFAKTHGGHCYYDYELDSDGQFNGSTGTTPIWLKNLLRGDPLAHIVEVDISNLTLDDVILGRIASCPKLRSLCLHRCTFNSDSIKCLGRCNNLQSLNLQEATITDSIGATLAKIPALQWLVLTRTGVSDKVVECLSESTDLVLIDLDHTNVTDKGIKHLENIPTLKFVYVRGTQVTAEEVERFKTVNTSCSVVR